MRLSHDIPSRLARLAFCLLMAYTWCGGPQAKAQAQAPAASPEAVTRTPEQRAAAAEQLRRSLRAIEQADRDLPRDTFEVGAVVKSVGNDPVKLFEWVRDQTTWIPYRGSLRGDVGVLMDRFGNSLDRALLLASLLKAAGHDARLSRGTLSLEQATAALPRVRGGPQFVAQPATAPTTAASGAAAPSEDPLTVAARAHQLDERSCREALDRLVFRHQKTQEAMAERIATQVPRLAELLLPADAPQVQTAHAAAVKDAQNAMCDHWWVQRNDGGKWIDLDPMLADAKPGEPLAPAATETHDPQKLPTDLLCQVEVRVIVERWEAGAAREATLLRHALRPSQLLGKRVTLSSSPMDWPQDFQLLGDDLPGRVGHAAAEQREWVPVLSIDGEVTIQSSVKESGDVVEKPALNAAARTGKGVKTKLEDAFGAFDAPPPAPSAPAAVAASHLTAQWIEYEVHMPGRAPQVVRREIFDLFGPAQPAAPTAQPSESQPPAGRRFCTLCGASLSPTAKFCTSCGAPRKP